MNDDLFRGLGIEIKFAQSDDFLKIKETLTRIGVAAKDTKTLYQSCHILHKTDLNDNSRYAIVHFKEMFKLDGKHSTISQNDLDRRNAIVKLLQDWNLLTVVDKSGFEGKGFAPVTSIKIVSYKDKKDWSLVQKYQIGRTK